ncbi:hypothetical protein AMTR_s00044p00187910 [Amborella trichopoda]|uniref:Uncharacterized protein n=1 Tax=Amborella trichopoda TaxID=13333 RepID=U5DA15_AMBTC|nr:hypothetical protein AMTR_s00044p00187910 [Amborella trichopoda]
MEYLSLEGETKSLFDDLHSIFGWINKPPKGKRKRKGTGSPDLICATPTRGARASGKGPSTLGSFPSPPPAKCVRGKASTTSNPHPVTSSSTPRVDSEATAARTEVSGPSNFDSSSKPARASVIMEAVIPPIASSLAPRLKLETIVAQPKVSSLTSFRLVHEPTRAPSSVVETTTPLSTSPIGSPACLSLSLPLHFC